MPESINDTIKLHPEWKELLYDEFQKPYMIELRKFLRSRLEAKKVIFPPPPDIFAALNLTPFSQVRIVLVGQDPYHGPNQAHGLSFSVKPGVPVPPSLVNIFKELRDDLGLSVPVHGSLVSWAKQGVLLLNAVLTVEQGRPGSHAGKGWEVFTDRVLAVLNEKKEHLVFMLWGAYAYKKGHFLDRSRHLVLTAPHPSPLSAHRGFLGCRHFSMANNYLREHQQAPIDWTLKS